MTKDQAISIKVRVETAMMSLQDASEHLPQAIGDDDTASETVAESLEDAISACGTALAMANSVIGA